MIDNCLQYNFSVDQSFLQARSQRISGRTSTKMIFVSCWTKQEGGASRQTVRIEMLLYVLVKSFFPLVPQYTQSLFT